MKKQDWFPFLLLVIIILMVFIAFYSLIGLKWAIVIVCSFLFWGVLESIKWKNK